MRERGNVLEVNKIYCGDCIEIMRDMPDDSIHSIVTDPPYGISFMNKKWDYKIPSVEVWKECLRILKPGGHILCACGTRTQHRMAVNIEDAGFEIRDLIAWIYGSGFPKSLDISKAIDKEAGIWRGKCGEISSENNSMTGVNYERTNKGTPATPEAKQWDGWGTALKPAWEAWTLAYKPIDSLTIVPPDIILTITNYLEVLLCQQLNVKFVEKVSMLSPKELDVGFIFALWNVVKVCGEKRQNVLEKTGMFKSQETEKTFWNIVLLWNSILKENYEKTKKYTISMEKEKITELKTLNLLLQASIYQNIIHAKEYKVNGLNANVLNVAKSLNNLNVSLENIQTLIAQENVLNNQTKNVIKELANIAGKNTIAEGKLSSVQENALSNLAPNMELWTLARKPLSESTIASNVLKHGTGGINADECRIEVNKNEEEKYLYADHSQGNSTPTVPIVPSNYKRGGGNKKGRFPANIIHDGSDEVVSLFPETESGDLLPHHNSCGESNIGTFNIRDRTGEIRPTYGDSGSAARFFYCPKASTTERNLGLDSTRTVKYIIDKQTIGGLSCKDVSTVLVGLLRKVMSESMVSWHIGEFGESITGQCQLDSLFTILTEINKITESKILHSLLLSITK